MTGINKIMKYIDFSLIGAKEKWSPHTMDLLPFCGGW
jgi:hypothetical protein